jgi:hypothetical protein
VGHGEDNPLAHICLAVLFGPAAHAQVLSSAVGTSNLSYSQAETITVSGIPSSLTFDPVTATTGTLNVTTTWQLGAARTRVAINLYFSVASSAMSDGNGHTIGANGIGANKGGGAFSPCGTAPDSILTGVIPAASACKANAFILHLPAYCLD